MIKLCLGRCIYCGKARKDEDGDLKWRSGVVLEGYRGENKIRFTVCPNCRSVPFVDIIMKVMQEIVKRKRKEKVY